MSRMTIVAAMVWLTACGAGGTQHHEVLSTPIDRPIGTVAVAAPVLLKDLDSAPEGDPFRTGVYVGNLVFAGDGYTTEELELGLQNVSTGVEHYAQDAFAEIASRHAKDAVEDALLRRGVDWRPFDPTGVPSPQIERRRGTHEEDGSDNISLPRFLLSAGPVEADDRADWPDVDAVVVPYVVAYYTHNAGWFLGQTWGCTAGARYRLFVATWDAQTGQVLGTLDATTRFLHPNLFQPNSSQLEDFQLSIEAQMEKRVHRDLWKKVD